jgi:hypothetical protein
MLHLDTNKNVNLTYVYLFECFLRRSCCPKSGREKCHIAVTISAIMCQKMDIHVCRVCRQICIWVMTIFACIIQTIDGVKRQKCITATFYSTTIFVMTRALTFFEFVEIVLLLAFIALVTLTICLEMCTGAAFEVLLCAILDEFLVPNYGIITIYYNHYILRTIIIII